MAEVEATLPEDGLDAGGLDAGPGRRVPERTCIATRVVQSPDTMIRFVRGPDGVVVPDLRAKLPGRGAWVSARRDAVAAAVRKNLFQRAFKGPAQAGPDLPDRIAAALRADLRQAIAMANKAGCVVAGFSKVEAAIGGQPGAVAVIHAAEASPDGRRKIAAALHRRHGEAMSRIPIVDDLSEDELDMALGRDHVIHAALVAGAGAAGCLSRWRRLRSFEGAAAATEEPDLARIGRIDEASR
ncbi:RNA-binding protein [Methylobacterium sp. NEAU K]|uniref:RNA-binding protein n=1 Tax=Methylobacterium sp. NEAU K TaxID=3064946 RepID=UPI002733A8EA|nr:RNA-binding protein [Methylobacterium sp. NEAU K]MDP4001864.1 RNA-binding protein [Methylobacterium sp. NEAU K]